MAIYNRTRIKIMDSDYDQSYTSINRDYREARTTMMETLKVANFRIHVAVKIVFSAISVSFT